MPDSAVKPLKLATAIPSVGADPAAQAAVHRSECGPPNVRRTILLEHPGDIVGPTGQRREQDCTSGLERLEPDGRSADVLAWQNRTQSLSNVADEVDNLMSVLHKLTSPAREKPPAREKQGALKR